MANKKRLYILSIDGSASEVRELQSMIKRAIKGRESELDVILTTKQVVPVSNSEYQELISNAIKTVLDANKAEIKRELAEHVSNLLPKQESAENDKYELPKEVHKNIVKRIKKLKKEEDKSKK